VHTSTHALKAVAGLAGQSPIHADKSPPGHPDGPGGVGPLPVVDPISPTLTFDQVTNELGCSLLRSEAFSLFGSHGPALPVSSQVIPSSESQRLNVRTIPSL